MTVFKKIIYRCIDQPRLTRLIRKSKFPQVSILRESRSLGGRTKGYGIGIVIWIGFSFGLIR